MDRLAYVADAAPRELLLGFAVPWLEFGFIALLWGLLVGQPWAAFALATIAAGAVSGSRLSARSPAAPPSWFVQATPPSREGALQLRWLQASDRGAWEANIDDEVIEWQGWDARWTRLFRSMGAHPGVARESGLMVAALDGEVVGAVAVHSIQWPLRSAQVGLWIGPGHREKGMASEVLRAVVEHLWLLGLTTVRLATSEDNVGMRRAAERAGAVEVARVPHSTPDGRAHEAVWYELRQVDSSG